MEGKEEEEVLKEGTRQTEGEYGESRNGVTPSTEKRDKEIAQKHWLSTERLEGLLADKW
jgi:hypothetical protein